MENREVATEHSSSRQVTEQANENQKPEPDISSSSAAVETNGEKGRKFIRTAEIKFMVDNVAKSTYDIESITTKNGGFVAYTKLESTVESVEYTPVSSDSTLQTTKFTVSNNMVIRVPNTKLDTTIKLISKHYKFLHYRVIKADDVALSMLSAKMQQDRASKNAKRLENAIDIKGKKLEEISTAIGYVANSEESRDEAIIRNLSLQDQVDYSTITLDFYQPESVKREVIQNMKNIDAYEPSFGKKLLEAFSIGWDVLVVILVFLAKIWGIILVALIIIATYRVVKRRYFKEDADN